MEQAKAEAVIEAVLFTMGESVEIGKLAELIGEDLRTTKKIIGKLQEKYAAADSGISLVYFDNAVQLCTKAEMYEYLIKIAKNARKCSRTRFWKHSPSLPISSR